MIPLGFFGLTIIWTPFLISHHDMAHHESACSNFTNSHITTSGAPYCTPYLVSGRRYYDARWVCESWTWYSARHAVRCTSHCKEACRYASVLVSTMTLRHGAYLSLSTSLAFLSTSSSWSLSSESLPSSSSSPSSMPSSSPSSSPVSKGHAQADASLQQ